jgi:hypothetical protein
MHGVTKAMIKLDADCTKYAMPLVFNFNFVVGISALATHVKFAQVDE